MERDEEAISLRGEEMFLMGALGPELPWSVSPLGHGSPVGTHRTDPGTEATQSPPPTQTPINSHNSTKGDETHPAPRLFPRMH